MSKCSDETLVAWINLHSPVPELWVTTTNHNLSGDWDFARAWCRVCRVCRGCGGCRGCRGCGGCGVAPLASALLDGVVMASSRRSMLPSGVHGTLLHSLG